MTFVHLQTAMIRCFGSLDFYFIDIDTEFLKKLETWLRTKAHYSDNSIGIRFRSLRTLYNQAVADNLSDKNVEIQFIVQDNFGQQAELAVSFDVGRKEPQTE